MIKGFKEWYSARPKPVRRGLCITFCVLLAAYFILMAVFFISILSQFFSMNQMKNQMLSNFNLSDMSQIGNIQLPNVQIGLKDPNDKMEEYAQDTLDTNYRMEFLNVGHADCMVLTNGNSTMMVDTGNAEDAKYILKHLEESEIQKLNYLVCTNESTEHSGGLMSVLENVVVDTLIIPDTETENEFMKDCISYAVSNGVTVKTANALDAWNIDEAQCIVLQNKGNVILKVSMLDISVLLLSDATQEEELALLDLEMDITANFIKASSHGAANTANDKLLQEVEAEYAIVSCDEEVAKPDIKTMNRLYKRAITYRTDRHDTIVVTTDGVFYELTTAEIDCNG